MTVAGMLKGKTVHPHVASPSVPARARSTT